MNYISEIFERLDIQQIREFLLHGTEEMNIDKSSYYDRLKSAEKTAARYLRSLYDDNEQYEESTIPVFRYVSTVEEVFMEIGMQCGSVLTAQFLSDTKKE